MRIAVVKIIINFDSAIVYVEKHFSHFYIVTAFGGIIFVKIIKEQNYEDTTAHTSF